MIFDSTKIWGVEAPVNQGESIPWTCREKDWGMRRGEGGLGGGEAMVGMWEKCGMGCNNIDWVML